jgi:hypothetical protein
LLDWQQIGWLSAIEDLSDINPRILPEWPIAAQRVNSLAERLTRRFFLSGRFAASTWTIRSGGGRQVRYDTHAINRFG